MFEASKISLCHCVTAQVLMDGKARPVKRQCHECHTCDEVIVYNVQKQKGSSYVGGISYIEVFNSPGGHTVSKSIYVC